MNRIAVPATKSSLLRLRADLEFLEIGRELLDQKRQVLGEALLTFHRESAALRRRVEASLADAWRFAAQAHATLGDVGVERVALAARPAPGPRVRERSLMGVVIPLIEPAEEPAEPGGLAVAPGETGAAADATAAALRALLPSLAELGELETCCARLAEELASTQRKLNALERIHIPAHRATIRFIADQLEEREREALFQLKRVKALAEGR
jgi:V/A-type H+-transporting ATPase subunit D